MIVSIIIIIIFITIMNIVIIIAIIAIVVVIIIVVFIIISSSIIIIIIDMPSVSIIEQCNKAILNTDRHLLWVTMNILYRHHQKDIIGRTHTHDDVTKWKHFPRYWPFVRDLIHHRANYDVIEMTQTMGYKHYCKIQLQ